MNLLEFFCQFIWKLILCVHDVVAFKVLKKSLIAYLCANSQQVPHRCVTPKHAEVTETK